MTTQNSTWLTIREAASHLGVSELTIRRRIKDRRLAHRLDKGKYYVSFDAPVTRDSATETARVPPPPAKPVDQIQHSSPARHVSDHPGRSTAPEQQPAVRFDLDALLTEHRRMAESSGRVAILEQQLRQLEERHSALQEGAMALANRNGWLEGKLEEREQEIMLLSDSSARRPWWKRLFAPKPDGS